MAIQAIVNIAEREGIAPCLCLQGTSLTVDSLFELDATISDSTEVAVIENAVAHLPKKAGYGIQAGQPLRLTNFGIWGLAVLTSPDVRSAFEAMSHFSELSSMLSKVKFRESQDQVAFVLEMSHLPESIHRFMFERYYATTVNFLKEVIPSYDISSFQIGLPFSDPVYEKQLGDMIRLKILPAQPNYSIIASKELLSTPFPSTDPLVHAHFIAECEGALRVQKQLPDHAQRIREFILNEKNFTPKLSEVAKLMFMSERTLKRRLQEEHHTFSEIVLSTKMTVARELLLTARLPVKVIAERLNYSESASFIRAFKKWWGTSPTEIENT
nr:AraC family transcriptional regulator [Pseudomaricurvus alkylphenolicus]